MKKAIIVGASSGIGNQLAHILSAKGFVLGLAARRYALLENLQQQLPGRSIIRSMDISQPAEAMSTMADLLMQMEGVDLIVISSAVCIHNPGLRWEDEMRTVNVNVGGFTAIANVAYRHFFERGEGHLVGISSFRAVRGGWASPAYNASKAYVSNYLEGLRIKSLKQGRNIIVSDIRPGLVATEMTDKKEGLFVASARKVALQIAEVIDKKETVAYVTKRYGIIARLLEHMPQVIYSRL